MSAVKEHIREMLTEMDTSFNGFFEWLEAQYDPASGGFFYARSSKLSEKFTPDIESTAQALNIIERCGLLGNLDEQMKQGLIRFFQSKQDPSTGYFYDADLNMKDDEVMVGRAISYSVGSIRKLGGNVLYPLPNSNSAAPDYIRSPQAYAEWLRSIDLCNSWRGCDRLCNSSPYLRQMDAKTREPFLREALNYFAEIQNPETGLWGEGSWYVRVSGTFKLHTFYGSFDVPMPRLQQMYESLKYTLEHDIAKDMCYIRNPINLLHSMQIDISDEDLEFITEVTLKNLLKLKQSDGGFSRELDHSPTAPNVAQVKKNEFYPDMPKPVHLGLGLREGDMNAGTQATLIRWSLYDLAGLEKPKLEIPPYLFAGYRKG
ncbi:hypothetical protein [Paenibacillus turpanensis]|uniref:hypothetical protein n=1 Tax=Paenibacillus turpanensis TaxID=2689078 RepID=UPI001408AB46|nr:hypothetical protein [Paenibacillus turpanensis]